MHTSIDFNEKKGFICDMDGVIYHGNRILPGVAEFIDWLRRGTQSGLFLQRAQLRSYIANDMAKHRVLFQSDDWLLKD